jgi:hypothetical protein
VPVRRLGTTLMGGAGRGRRVASQLAGPTITNGAIARSRQAWGPPPRSSPFTWVLGRGTLRNGESRVLMALVGAAVAAREHGSHTCNEQGTLVEASPNMAG